MVLEGGGTPAPCSAHTSRHHRQSQVPDLVKRCYMLTDVSHTARASRDVRRAVPG